MIQFNLLPDVKIEFIKAKRTKRMVMVSSTLVTIVSLAIMISLFLLVNVVQKKHLSNLSQDIASTNKKLQDIPDISKILTIQNQLLSLEDVHNQKPVVSRLRSYVEQVTPSNISISELSVNFTEPKITIKGSGKTLADINKYADTLKFTKYSLEEETESKDAFSKVVLTNFGKGQTDVIFTLDFEYDPAIFSAESEVKLNVPKITTTRSEQEKPAALFQEAPKPTTSGGDR